MITQDLGIATAYGYAKSKGYTGTEAEFAELMASYASTAQTAIEAANRAVEANTAAQSAKTDAQASKTAAQTAAQTATTKASEAVTAAGTATTKASEASQSASTASAAATFAGTSAQTATTAATTATTKAREASESATTASRAKTDAETARDAAAQSASEAAESARTMTIDATLTQSGQAADAKVVGDRFNKNELSIAELEDFTLSETTKTIESVITVQAGTTIPSSRHVFDPVNIHEDTLYKLYFEDSDNILGAFTIYANGAAIKSNCITNTEYSFTASADVTYLSIYCQNTHALESGTVTARLSVVTKNENSLEEQIGHISDALQLGGSRNLVEYDWAQAAFSNDEYTPSKYHKNTSMYYTPAIGGEYYTITWGDAVNTSTTLSVYEYDENKTYLKITRAQYSKHSLTLQLDNETAFIILNIYGASETLWTNLVPEWTQIEKGNYATNYVKPQVINNRGIDEVDLYARMVNSKCFESSPNVPTYYFEGGYLFDKANTINTLAQSCAANGDVFAFVTDEHWEGNQKNSHSLIKYLDFQCHIPRLFSGGDIANYDNIRGEFANSLRSNYRNRIYHIAGNHDWFSPATVNSIYYALNMYSHDIHGVPGRTYYYADNDAMRIRYIILNAFTRSDGSTSVTTGYDTAQLEWLNTVLTSTPDNYDIIVFTHYCGLITPSPTGAGYFRNALDAFNAGSHTGKVLAIFQGHTHFDAVNHTTGGIPIVTTTCDKNTPWSVDGADQEPWITSQRISGTITEQAFDIMILNRNARTITAVRIGALAMDNTDLNEGDDGWTYTGTLEQRVITY